MIVAIQIQNPTMPIPEIFTVPPTQPGPKPGQLSKEQVVQFFEEVYYLIYVFL